MAANAYRRWRWIGVGLLLLVLVLSGWLLNNVLPYAIICPDRLQRWEIYHACTPADYGLNADDMWVETEPGLFLRGWRVRTNQTARGTVVLLHGSASCKESMLALARLLSEHGYQCLLYDSRACGESGGKFCTFGFYERRDFARFVEAAKQRFGPLEPLAVFGSSMGGAVALQTMADQPRICCGVVESPFTSLREIVHDYMKHDSGVPFFFVSDFALGRAAQIARFSVAAVNPEDAAGRIRQPVLLTHGTNDHWIAFRYGERISRQLRAPGSIWHPVPGADHTDVWKIGGEEYKKLVLDFLDQHCH